MNPFQMARSWSSALLDLLSHTTTTYAKTVVALVLAISALSVWYSRRHLDFVTSRNQLISSEKRYLQLDDEYADTFHGLEQVVVVAEGPDLEETKVFMQSLSERLKADTAHVQEVFYHIDTDSLAGKKLLWLSADDLRSLHDKLEESRELMRDVTAAPGLNTLLTAMNRRISATMVSHLTQGFLGLAESPDSENTAEQKGLSLSFFRSLLEQMQQALTVAPFSYRSPWRDFFGNDELGDDGFLVSDDKRFVFLMVEPQNHGEGFDAQQEAIAAIRRHIAELRQTFPRVQAGVTGDEALGNDEMLTAQTDSSLASLVSLLGVGILYLLFFRSIRRTLILLATVMVGLTWTMGLLTLTVGHLSIISIFVASILIGLADDRVVYFLIRYEEERDLGRSFHEAIHRTFTHAAPGIVAAAVTNALAFYAMMLADFRGIQELGFIAGNGMLLSLAVTLTFLPALLTLTEGRALWRQSTRRDTWLAQAFTRMGRAAQRLRQPVLLVATGVSLLCLLALPTISFDYNLLHLQARGTESVTWEQQLVEHAGRSSWFALATAPSLAEAAQKAARFEVLPSVEKVETISSLVPERQEERLQLVHALAPFFADLPSPLIASAAVDIEELKHTLARVRFKLPQENADGASPQKPAEREIGEVRQRLTEVIGRLETLSATDAAAALQRLQQPLFQDFAEKWALLRDNLNPSGPITLADIPIQLRSRFVSADGQKFLLQIYPRKDIWDRAPLEEFVSQLRRADPDVTGSPVIGYESIQAIKNGYVEGGEYAGVAILGVALLTLGRVSVTLLAALPVLCGMLWTAGLMWVCDLKLNLANLVAVPITIGIGIESGIYLVRRAHEETKAGGLLVGESTGQSVALFSLSTMVGFGSLMVARHYGIFSMGLLLTLAVGSVLLVSLTILPLLLHTSTPGVSERGRKTQEKTATASPTECATRKAAVG
jgi:hopanoid biosynthesis associated RND transporter like protein HpnN